MTEIEIPFWIFGQQKWVSGINKSTTCQEVCLTYLVVSVIVERTLAYQDYFLKTFKIMFKSNRVHLSHVENNGLEQNSTCSSLNVYPGPGWPG